MQDITTPKTHESPTNLSCQDSAIISTISRLLVPLARLCLANGITFAAVEEALKHAFVQEADALEPEAPVHGTVSRISISTGINRREVTRLTKLKIPNRPTKPPLAAEVFARWTTDAAWQDRDGTPSVLNRQGSAPSFEVLAQSVTRDLHPRSLLDELIRLGLVIHDEELDCVSLTRGEFVPRNDSQQMLNFMSDNVGDHLDAAVANVLHGGCRHLEQAVFADELSAESIEALRPLITNQWQALRDSMVPTITALSKQTKVPGARRIRECVSGFIASPKRQLTPLHHSKNPLRTPNVNPPQRENSNEST